MAMSRSSIAARILYETNLASLLKPQQAISRHADDVWFPTPREIDAICAAVWATDGPTSSNNQAGDFSPSRREDANDQSASTDCPLA